MDSAGKDIFVVNNREQSLEEISLPNIFQKGKQENNFFLAEEVPHLKSATEPARRINDYDSNLLQADAYKEIPDDVFKLEYKISRLEEEIKDIDGQLIAAHDIGDQALANKLKGRLITLRDEYETLLTIYSNKSLSAKISDGLSGVLGSNIKASFESVHSRIKNISDLIISKLPKKILSAIEIKKSLAKLENINKSVDELMKLKIPYGECVDKYSQLSKYIIRANSIQSIFRNCSNKVILNITLQNSMDMPERHLLFTINNYDCMIVLESEEI